MFARPLAWIVALAALGIAVPWIEEGTELSAFLATEPGSAQVLLATIAGAVMTVVAVVYSILLVALSLASMQFSTRILAGMLRDRVAQNTLGLFIGTFVYCVLVLRAVHGDPQPFVPGVAVGGAVLLALSSLAGLVWFIHHIVSAIQANQLVHRIAVETEAVIDDVFRVSQSPEGPSKEDPVLPSIPADASLVPSDRSGYIQLIDVAGLAAIGAARVQVLRPMGAFVAAGLPLLAVSPAPTDVQRAAALRAVDIGAMRTMQADVEFGIRQIVDIALKAISPAVNDPSTAATCIDHLGRLLVRVAQRQPAPIEHGGVVVPHATQSDLIDLAFEQLRQYGRADMAVALRIMRALGEVASVTKQAAARRRIELHARLIEAAARTHFAPEDCDELARRYAVVRAHVERA